ncbi:hypothetical protein [Planomicrobium sp. CPCC 101079]|uniref:hypothetical protein n=1 Tax=Planomicrobium sp. CPCC 101079 TaxID=2599618 RepID=UPI0011B538A7|nr:hypothetical protein [Planomicrobium sp. CPCC 101079]TWT05861.1 hypothetical protein FQV28_07740 [Planomicrobium sp. CPCC 101079]
MVLIFRKIAALSAGFGQILTRARVDFGTSLSRRKVSAERHLAEAMQEHTVFSAILLHIYIK